MTEVSRATAASRRRRRCEPWRMAIRLPSATDHNDGEALAACQSRRRRPAGSWMWTRPVGPHGRETRHDEPQSMPVQ